MVTKKKRGVAASRKCLGNESWRRITLVSICAGIGDLFLRRLLLLSFAVVVRLIIRPPALNCPHNSNETETKQFENCFETVLKLFRFSFVSVLFQLCRQF